MDAITCEHCGEQIKVAPSNIPLTFREDPPDEQRAGQYVIMRGGWLLHRCEIGD